jgi:hypothetical protein
MKFEVISAISPESGAGALIKNSVVAKSMVDFIARTSLYPAVQPMRAWCFKAYVGLPGHPARSNFVWCLFILVQKSGFVFGLGEGRVAPKPARVK